MAGLIAGNVVAVVVAWKVMFGNLSRFNQAFEATIKPKFWPMSEDEDRREGLGILRMAGFVAVCVGMVVVDVVIVGMMGE